MRMQILGVNNNEVRFFCRVRPNNPPVAPAVAARTFKPQRRSTLSDTVSGWSVVGKLPSKDVAGVTHSVPTEIPAKKSLGALGTKTSLMTEKGKPARKLYRPQTAEAPPVPAELVPPQTAKPQSAPAPVPRLQVPSLSAPTSAGRTSSAMSTRDWLNLCREDRTTEQAMQCFDYTRGYADALQFWWLVEEDTAKICIPSETTSEKLRDVGVAWIRKEAKDLSEPIGENLGLAFFYKWRCKEKKNN